MKINQKVPAVVWLIVIAILSGFPGSKVPEIPIWQFDKLVHSLMYAVLSGSLIMAYYQQYRRPEKRSLLYVSLFLFGVFYGGIMEILQYYIFINRSGSWYDFFANAFGALLGIILFPIVTKLLPINRWFKID
ncbi:MAG: VanZ family protein [Flavobacteriales bacterium]|nr:VanZ family protein [Flavobacteriales bacterium]